jgi:alpha-1,6-mannosyltransferase
VLGCLLIVVLAANRPSFLAATSVWHYFPGWMAGPLGGLWPSFTRNTEALKAIVTGAIVAMYASYVLAVRLAPRLPARWAIAAVIGVHVVMLLCPPFSLTDVFNYINYGRMEIMHHLNPYTTIPVLEPHSDPTFALSNWHKLLSPYGPLFTLITFAVVPLGVGGAFWALKALLMLASLATVLLVYKSARLLGRDPVAAIVLVGLNPIVLVWGLGGDHNDAFMMLLVVLGFYLMLRARVSPEADRLYVGAGAAFVAAVFMKASAGILLPIALAALLHERRALIRVIVGMVLTSVVFGIATLIAFGAHIPDLSTQGRLVTDISIPNLLGLLLGQGGETETLRKLLELALLGLIAACCVRAYRRREPFGPAAWATMGLLVTLSWVLPWYVLWALPLVALSGSRRLRNATLVFGVYLIAAWTPLSGAAFTAIGFTPEKTPLGRLHQRYVRELLY